MELAKLLQTMSELMRTIDPCEVNVPTSIGVTLAGKFYVRSSIEDTPIFCDSVEEVERVVEGVIAKAKPADEVEEQQYETHFFCPVCKDIKEVVFSKDTRLCYCKHCSISIARLVDGVMKEI